SPQRNIVAGFELTPAGKPSPPSFPLKTNNQRKNGEASDQPGRICCTAESAPRVEKPEDIESAPLAQRQQPVGSPAAFAIALLEPLHQQPENHHGHPPNYREQRPIV